MIGNVFVSADIMFGFPYHADDVTLHILYNVPAVHFN